MSKNDENIELTQKTNLSKFEIEENEKVVGARNFSWFKNAKRR